MRFLGVLRTDLRFQYKQGLYTVYVVLTIVYLILLQKLPAGGIREYAVPLVVFSDPSLVGYFFIGGIVMLEKQQGITDYLAVTPLSPAEYIVSKAVSLGILASAASFMITLESGAYGINWVCLLAGVLLTSLFFTLYGFIIAAGCRTINQYFIRMIPFLLLAALPCFSVIEFSYSWLFEALPNVSGLMLILGAFRGISGYKGMLCILVLCIWNALMFWAALRVYDKKILYGGAGK